MICSNLTVRKEKKNILAKAKANPKKYMRHVWRVLFPNYFKLDPITQPLWMPGGTLRKKNGCTMSRLESVDIQSVLAFSI